MYRSNVYTILFLLRKEERRVFETYTTFSTVQFREKLLNLLYLKKLSDSNVRIYSCCNARDLGRVIKHMEQGLLDAHYCDDFNRQNIYKKTCGGQRHYIMQPQNALEKNFILDIDDIEGSDEMGKALHRVQELGLEELLRYRTKSGWHIVTKPFNPALWGNDQLKKDPMLLLSF